MDRKASLNPIITTTLFIFSFTLIMSNTIVRAGACTPKDSGPVIPTTPLITFLERVQEAALKTYGHKGFDPKLYVDMSLKKNLSTTLEAFDKLPRTANGSISVEELNGFLEKYLGGAAEDLVYVDPLDFCAEPEDFLPKVKSPEVRAWALEVHSLWKNLSRKVSGQVLEKPNFYTLLPLENPVIIPGSRFREVYYWDSYWVIRGLLASKMYETAKGIVYNLISLIDEFGHVLNGARAYYTNRSQPPLLSSMVIDIYNRTHDEDLVIRSLPALVKEHEFWNSDAKMVDDVVLSLQNSGLVRSFGIATSLTNSGQQWDFPNGWAPLQHMIVEGLVRSGSRHARSVAKDIVVNWTRTNYVAYKETGAMHEKYDVEKCGGFGGGGEYVPQTGFGWSNGVVLAFLEEFGWPKNLKLDCS
ncbi:Trehalase [Sesamum angolense]|uniref:alpha,alpha-trehalase n=1 Tax=Sesamum angolense TaxID=2727404 RepID=A0AAE1WAL4_9LAMI|nr:Trehalase [Sesamum angolense]